MSKNLIISLFSVAALLLFSLLQLAFSGHAAAAYLGVIRPVLYLLLAMMLYFVFDGKRVFGRQNNNFITCAIVAVVYLMVFAATGVIFGFGKNGTAPDFLAVLEGLWRVGLVIVFSEYIRLKLVSKVEAKHLVWFGLLLSLALAFSTAQNIRLFFRDLESVFTAFVPAVAVSLFLTYMAVDGSLAGLVIFRAAVELPAYILPVLPAISPFLRVIILCLLMFFTYIVTTGGSRRVRRPTTLKRRRVGFAVPTVVCVVIALALSFGLGAFPIEPVAVASNSMKNEFERGSLVLVEQLSGEDVIERVKKDDIIRFKRGNRSVVHRVVEIRTDPFGEVSYVTRGDNNPSNDAQPVQAKDVTGIVINYIKYLGLPAVWVMEITGGG